MALNNVPLIDGDTKPFALLVKLLLKWWIYAFCALKIAEVIPKFHLHAVLTDTVRYGDALKCAN